MTSAPWVSIPDETLLRRFGIVRAVGGGAYIIACLIIGWLYGRDALPLLVGIPILGVVTTVYFQRSMRAPRTAVALSLVADCIVLGGAAAFVGGTGSGTGALYVIPIVSAGIILGPAAATGFTVLGVLLAWLQLASEELLLVPAHLHRPELGDRIVVLMIITAVLISVGYLTGTYASSLQDDLASAEDAADQVARRTQRRRSFVRQASRELDRTIDELEQIARALEDPDPLGADERQALAARLRTSTAELHGGVDELADAGAMDEARTHRLEPVLLSAVVADVMADLQPRLTDHEVTVDVPPIRVVGDRRAARRIAHSLVQNVIEHTPPGTRLWVEGRRTGGHGVLVVADDGPGVPSGVAHRLFDPPDEGGGPRVGMPLVRELVDAMGGEVTYEPRTAGGSIFLVGLRLAPRDAPEPDLSGDA